ncbi:MAG: hypothetical protein H6537_04920 [Bacteroidales bacterium]|nr:hypothetical protein [Bacteroidales bacterium]
MNQTQINRKHMVETTLSFLDENVATWQSIAKIGEVKNKLSDVNQAIDKAAADQSNAQVNMGKIKTELKRTICEKADIMNDIVEAFALITGNEMLAQTMADSASDLFKMKNDDMLRRVKQIIDAATANKEALTADYGFTTEQITDLQADYDRFLELNGQPHEYRVKSSVATLTLEELFAEASNLLTNQLDNLMKIFKRRDANLYNGYLKARMVVDY